MSEMSANSHVPNTEDDGGRAPFSALTEHGAGIADSEDAPRTEESLSPSVDEVENGALERANVDEAENATPTIEDAERGEVEVSDFTGKETAKSKSAPLTIAQEELHSSDITKEEAGSVAPAETQESLLLDVTKEKEEEEAGSVATTEASEVRPSDSARQEEVEAPKAETTEASDASVAHSVDVEHQEQEAETLPSAVPARGGRLSRRARWRTYSRRRRIVSLVLLSVVGLGILVPLVISIAYGIRAYTTYNTVRNEAFSGVQHLMNIKTIFSGVKAHPTDLLDVNNLHRVRGELNAARGNFQQVQSTLNHSDIIQMVSQYLTQYRPQIGSARVASQMGIDAIDIGQDLVSAALVLAPSFRGPLLTNSTQPLVTQPMLDLVGRTIDHIMPYLSDIQALSHNLSLDALPISAGSREQVASLLQALPQVQSDLQQVRGLLGSASWMLGIDQPRTFLVQTMDSAELRPTGGFTGQYGDLHMNSGRVGDFSLKDIGLLEKVPTSVTIGQAAPSQYPWWPIANWGLRDSNLSADFPTSAKIAMQQYQHEVGEQVDGVILFTPFFIEHILDVIGPIDLPAYHDTITAQNLEDRLHYYQQDNSGIRKQEIIQHVNIPDSARKLFTGLLAHMLMDHVRHAPPGELLAIAREALHDLKTKDLQIYVTNPQLESLLVQYGDAAEMDRSTTHDGLYVVQANIDSTKASQYVRTTMYDTVTLNSNGGATHVMQLRLAYTQTGPVYGYDAYRDYVRVYVPPNSKLLGGDGFDTGIPLCGGPAPLCPQTDVYPRDELLCPPGQFQPGAATPSLTDEDPGHWHPLDTVGPPTNTKSDEPGRAMFGGWVVVPKNCTMTVTLSWYVPPMGSQPYALLVQRQAGTFPELDLTIVPTASSCATLKTQGEHFDDVLTEDAFFPLKTFRPTTASSLACYPHSGV